MKISKEKHSELIAAYNLICEHACSTIPAGWTVSLEMSKEGCEVRLFGEHGDNVEIGEHDEGFSEIHNACKVAIEGSLSGQYPFLDVGDCVIADHCDRPCSGLIAVIVSRDGPDVRVQYLSDDPDLDPFNEPPMKVCVEELTRIERFGVCMKQDGDNYWCEVTGESTATYKDGGIRKWQEHRDPEICTSREDVAEFMIPF